MSAGEAASFSADSFLKADRQCLADIPCRELSIDEVMPYFDWRMFLAVWGIRYGTDIGDNPEAMKIIDEGKAVIEECRRTGRLKIMLAERILEAKSDGSSIIFRDGGSIPMLRQWFG